MCAGEGTPVGNIVQILLGLAKSYFNIKGKTNTSIQVRLVTRGQGGDWVCKHFLLSPAPVP